MNHVQALDGKWNVEGFGKRAGRGYSYPIPKRFPLAFKRSSSGCKRSIGELDTTIYTKTRSAVTLTKTGRRRKGAASVSSRVHKASGESNWSQVMF